MDFKFLSAHEGQTRILRRSSIWYYKHAADQNLLNAKLQTQLRLDIKSLYEQSNLSDLKLITSEGHTVCCHQQIISIRYQSVWFLLSEISKIQIGLGLSRPSTSTKKRNKSLIIALPCVSYGCLEPFIRSLYSSSVDKLCASFLLSLLDQYLKSLQQRSHSQEFKLYLEKIPQHEEKHIQQMLYNQLKNGEISEAKGNLRVLNPLSKPQFASRLPVPSSVHRNDPQVVTNGIHHVSKTNGFMTPVSPFEQSFDDSVKKLRSLRMSCEDSSVKEVHGDEGAIARKPLENLGSHKTRCSPENVCDQVMISEQRQGARGKVKQVDSKAGRKSLPECSFKSSSRPINLSLSEKSPHLSDEMKFLFTQSLHDEENPDLDFDGMQETSSLEVELPSSLDEHSFSANSGLSEDNLDVMDSNKQESDDDEPVKFTGSKNIEVNLLKPLVRTRTFDLIDPTCAAFQGDLTSPDQIVLDNSKLDEDSEKLKGLERLKGSLIFDQTPPTYCNIPSSTVGSSEGTILAQTLHQADSLIGTPPILSLMATNSCFKDLSPAILKTDTIPHHDRPPLLPQISREEALELHLELTKRGPGSRSPSPDSLSMDLSPQFPDCKETFNVEEKEKDERETTMSLITTFQEKRYQTFTISDRTKVLQISENVPTVSGDQTKQTLEPLVYQRIARPAVKDVDSIPLISGYNTLMTDSQDFNAKSANVQHPIKPHVEDTENQSMFSMFIDFDNIPPPAKEPENIDSAKNATSKGGMFMFIEAESTPKHKRSPKPECDGKKNKDKKASKELLGNNVGDRTSIEPHSILKSEKKHEENFTTSNVEKSTCDQPKEKGFFVFIEADTFSKTSSPKPRRRPPVRIQGKSKGSSNMMSKSAPSDSLLFLKGELNAKQAVPEISSKFMTKSVIDREEFMAQTPARRNVSLNDKINESSSKIPRPIKDFKEKIVACKEELEVLQKLKKFSKKENKLRSKMTEQSKSLETSTTSEAATSLTSSLNETESFSLPHDMEEVTEFSDISSLLSSLGRLNGKSDQEGKASQAALGDDLLKMFINEINTDVTIQIGEKKIHAHKCILASRCVYFAAMLSGHWVESAGNIIKLQGFSYEVVMEALKHIYSGSGTVPPGINVSELAAISDMLALDGLKEVVSLHYKANLCHYFHKPCPECIHGVLEVLPVAGAYCIDDLYHKCLRWISKNLEIIFPTKNFCSLPLELQQRCLKQIMDDMCVTNVIDNALGAERILSTLPNVKWAHTSLDLSAELMEAVTNFMSSHLSAVITSQKFLSLGRDNGWTVDSLEETLKMVCEVLRPDEAVLSHIELSKLIEEIRHEESEFSEEFIDMCKGVLKMVEKFIIHNANRVAVCRQWPLLAPNTQKRIKDAAAIVLEFSKPVEEKPKLNYSPNNRNTNRSRGTSLEPITRVRASSMSDRLIRSASSTAVPQVQGRKLQTPPPTRASTLRAQARQVAIQRSHSARLVGDNINKRLQTSGCNSSSDAEDGNSLRPSSKNDENQSRSRTPGGGIQPPSGLSRSSTPGGLIDKKRKTLSAFKSKMSGKDVFQNSYKPQQSEDSDNSKFVQHASSNDVNSTVIYTDTKKQHDSKHLRGMLHLPAMGRRTRPTFLRDSHRPTKPPCYVPDEPAAAAATYLQSAESGAPAVGLGNRSNTFSLDDGGTLTNR